MNLLLPMKLLCEIHNLPGSEADSLWDRIASDLLPDSFMEYHTIMKNRIVFFLASNTKQRWSGI